MPANKKPIKITKAIRTLSQVKKFEKERKSSSAYSTEGGKKKATSATVSRKTASTLKKQPKKYPTPTRKGSATNPKTGAQTYKDSVRKRVAKKVVEAAKNPKSPPRTKGVNRPAARTLRGLGPTGLRDKFSVISRRIKKI